MDNNRQNTDLPPGLAKPALRALTAAGISRLDQLSGFSEAEVRRMHGIGPRAFEQLRGAMALRGISFKDGSR